MGEAGGGRGPRMCRVGVDFAAEGGEDAGDLLNEGVSVALVIWEQSE